MNSHPEAATRIEGRQSTTTGVPFLVGFFFAFRMFIMLLSVRLLRFDPKTGTGIALMLNLLLPVVLAFQYLGNAQHSLSSILRPWSVRWCFIFLAFSGCSLTWTVAASPAAAILYWCGMAADVAIVILLLRNSSDVSIPSLALMKGYVYGACLVAACAWFLPAQSDLRLGDEELLGPNQIGYLCAFALFLVQYLIRQTKRNWTPALLLLAITLLRTLSKTTLVAFFVAQLFLLAVDPSMRRKTKAMLIAATVLTGMAFTGLLSAYYDLYTSSGNSPETLTGRIGIWAYILNEAVARPWIGHGIYSVWKVIPSFGTFEARHAHNELLQQFYSYGVFGVLITAAIYGAFYLQIRGLWNKPQRAYFMALLIFVLVRGLADTEIVDLSLPLWAIIMFAQIINGARRAREPHVLPVMRRNCHSIVIS